MGTAKSLMRDALDASISPAGAQKVALHARTIDLALLGPLMPQGQQIAGDLSADIMISGTSAAPLIEANLGVNGLMMNSQRLGDVNATADYKPSTAALDVAIHQDQNHQLRLSGAEGLGGQRSVEAGSLMGRLGLLRRTAKNTSPATAAR